MNFDDSSSSESSVEGRHSRIAQKQAPLRSHVVDSLVFEEDETLAESRYTQPKQAGASSSSAAAAAVTSPVSQSMMQSRDDEEEDSEKRKCESHDSSSTTSSSSSERPRGRRGLPLPGLGSHHNVNVHCREGGIVGQRHEQPQTTSTQAVSAGTAATKTKIRAFVAVDSEDNSTTATDAAGAVAPAQMPHRLSMRGGGIESDDETVDDVSYEDVNAAAGAGAHHLSSFSSDNRASSSNSSKSGFSSMSEQVQYGLDKNEEQDTLTPVAVATSLPFVEGGVAGAGKATQEAARSRSNSSEHSNPLRQGHHCLHPQTQDARNNSFSTQDHESSTSSADLPDFEMPQARGGSTHPNVVPRDSSNDDDDDETDSERTPMRSLPTLRDSGHDKVKPMELDETQFSHDIENAQSGENEEGDASDDNSIAAQEVPIEETTAWNTCLKTLRLVDATSLTTTYHSTVALPKTDYVPDLVKVMSLFQRAGYAEHRADRSAMQRRVQRIAYYMLETQQALEEAGLVNRDGDVEEDGGKESVCAGVVGMHVDASCRLVAELDFQPFSVTLLDVVAFASEPLAESEFIALLRSATLRVASLHQNGFVHGALHAANVLFSLGDGRCTLTQPAGIATTSLAYPSDPSFLSLALAGRMETAVSHIWADGGAPPTPGRLGESSRLDAEEKLALHAIEMYDDEGHNILLAHVRPQDDVYALGMLALLLYIGAPALHGTTLQEALSTLARDLSNEDLYVAIMGTAYTRNRRARAAYSDEFIEHLELFLSDCVNAGRSEDKGVTYKDAISLLSHPLFAQHRLESDMADTSNTTTTTERERLAMKDTVHRTVYAVARIVDNCRSHCGTSPYLPRLHRNSIFANRLASLRDSLRDLLSGKEGGSTAAAAATAFQDISKYERCNETRNHRVAELFFPACSSLLGITASAASNASSSDLLSDRQEREAVQRAARERLELDSGCVIFPHLRCVAFKENKNALLTLRRDDLQCIAEDNIDTLLLRDLENCRVEVLAGFRYIMLANISHCELLLGPALACYARDVRHCAPLAVGASYVLLDDVSNVALHYPGVNPPEYVRRGAVRSLETNAYCVSYPGLTEDYKRVCQPQEMSGAMPALLRRFQQVKSVELSTMRAATTQSLQQRSNGCSNRSVDRLVPGGLDCATGVASSIGVGRTSSGAADDSRSSASMLTGYLSLLNNTTVNENCSSSDDDDDGEERGDAHGKPANRKLELLGLERQGHDYPYSHPLAACGAHFSHRDDGVSDCTYYYSELRDKYVTIADVHGTSQNAEDSGRGEKETFEHLTRVSEMYASIQKGEQGARSFKESQQQQEEEACYASPRCPVIFILDVVSDVVVERCSNCKIFVVGSINSVVVRDCHHVSLCFVARECAITDCMDMTVWALVTGYLELAGCTSVTVLPLYLQCPYVDEILRAVYADAVQEGDATVVTAFEEHELELLNVILRGGGRQDVVVSDCEDVTVCDTEWYAGHPESMPEMLTVTIPLPINEHVSSKQLSNVTESTFFLQCCETAGMHDVQSSFTYRAFPDECFPSGEQHHVCSEEREDLKETEKMRDNGGGGMLQPHHRSVVRVHDLVDASIMRLEGALQVRQQQRFTLGSSQRLGVLCDLLIQRVSVGEVHIADAVGSVLIEDCTGPLNIVVAAAQLVILARCDNVTVRVACQRFAAQDSRHCHVALLTNNTPLFLRCAYMGVSALNITSWNYEELLARAGVETDNNHILEVVLVPASVTSVVDIDVVAARTTFDVVTLGAPAPADLDTSSVLVVKALQITGGVTDARARLDRPVTLLMPLSGVCLGMKDGAFVQAVEELVEREACVRPTYTEVLTSALEYICSPHTDMVAAEEEAARRGAVSLHGVCGGISIEKKKETYLLKERRGVDEEGSKESERQEQQGVATPEEHRGGVLLELVISRGETTSSRVCDGDDCYVNSGGSGSSANNSSTIQALDPRTSVAATTIRGVPLNDSSNSSNSNSRIERKVDDSHNSSSASSSAMHAYIPSAAAATTALRDALPSVTTEHDDDGLEASSATGRGGGRSSAAATTSGRRMPPPPPSPEAQEDGDSGSHNSSTSQVSDDRVVVYPPRPELGSSDDDEFSGDAYGKEAQGPIHSIDAHAHKETPQNPSNSHHVDPVSRGQVTPRKEMFVKSSSSSSTQSDDIFAKSSTCRSAEESPDEHGSHCRPMPVTMGRELRPPTPDKPFETAAAADEETQSDEYADELFEASVHNTVSSSHSAAPAVSEKSEPTRKNSAASTASVLNDDGEDDEEEQHAEEKKEMVEVKQYHGESNDDDGDATVQLDRMNADTKMDDKGEKKEPKEEANSTGTATMLCVYTQHSNSGAPTMSVQAAATEAHPEVGDNDSPQVASADAALVANIKEEATIASTDSSITVERTDDVAVQKQELTTLEPQFSAFSPLSTCIQGDKSHPSTHVDPNAGSLQYDNKPGYLGARIPLYNSSVQCPSSPDVVLDTVQSARESLPTAEKSGVSSSASRPAAENDRITHSMLSSEEGHELLKAPHEMPLVHSPLSSGPVPALARHALGTHDGQSTTFTTLNLGDTSNSSSVPHDNDKGGAGESTRCPSLSPAGEWTNKEETGGYRRPDQDPAGHAGAPPTFLYIRDNRDEGAEHERMDEFAGKVHSECEKRRQLVLSEVILRDVRNEELRELAERVEAARALYLARVVKNQDLAARVTRAMQTLERN